MGLDANVMCNCYSGELEVPAEFRGLICFDEEGYLGLREIHPVNEEIYTKFDLWTRNICKHEDMYFACEGIANWTGVGLFKSALKSHGVDIFQSLLSEIPENNGGLTKPEDAKRMLVELDLFDKTETVKGLFVLLDSEEDMEIWQWSDGANNSFVLSGQENISMSMGKHGFYITKDNVNVFHSNEFIQELLEPKKTMQWEDGKVKYIDVASGGEFECYSAIPGEQIPWPSGSWENEKGQACFKYPKKFHTEWCKDTPEKYNYITKSLRTICEASVNTGNPIRWT